MYPFKELWEKEQIVQQDHVTFNLNLVNVNGGGSALFGLVKLDEFMIEFDM